MPALLSVFVGELLAREGLRGREEEGHVRGLMNRDAIPAFLSPWPHRAVPSSPLALPY